jgi:hypothetical protein
VATANQYISVDVTAMVKQWLNNPGANFGVALAAAAIATPGAQAFFDSKENTATGHSAAMVDVVLADQGPRGLPGAKGDKGDKGDPGPTGATGATGATGRHGPARRTGRTGRPGAARGQSLIHYGQVHQEHAGRQLRTTRTMYCPANWVVVGGGCGHRDYNSAQQEHHRQLRRTRSDQCARQSLPSARVQNSKLVSSRAVRSYIICLQAGSVSGP